MSRLSQLRHNGACLLVALLAGQTAKVGFYVAGIVRAVRHQ